MEPVAQTKTLIPSSLAQLPSYSKLLMPNRTQVQGEDFSQMVDLIQRQQSLNHQILDERMKLGTRLPSSALLQFLDKNNYGDCMHIATAVNNILQENSNDLSSCMPNGIVVLMWRRNYYTMVANFASAPFLYQSRVGNMDEKTRQAFRNGCSSQASPKHVFNVLNLPKDLAKTLDRKGKLFLSPDFRELGDKSIIIDPWLTDDLVFPSSEANVRYQESFNTSYPIVMLLKPDHPINSVCLW